MKNISLFIAVAFLATILTAPVMARPITPTEEYPTWDLDMINIEGVSETGAGVYVAVLDTGLAPNWRDYFPKERIAAKLGIGFYEPCYPDPKTGEIIESGKVHTTTFIGSTGACHGTHVTSTIIGYYYHTPIDTAWGYWLPPIFVKGVAPDVTIIPVKVLADYSFPKWAEYAGHDVVFGTDKMVAAGIYYATDLAIAGCSPMIITMSLGGPEPSETIKAAIDYAISEGVIVVAAAGNSGTVGMDWPGAYPEVISVGACGWKYEWWWPAPSEYPASPDDLGDGPNATYIDYYYPWWDARNRLWWLQSPYNGWRNVTEGSDLDSEVYIATWSSRENDTMVPDYDQQLDVVAPGSWVRGPYPGTPGYAHLPWWSQGWGSLMRNPGNFYYAGGTSMSTPHVAGVAALMLEKDPELNQSEIEAILKSNTLPIPPGSMDIVDVVSPGWGWTTVTWDTDATGAGLIDAEAALAATP